MHGLCVCVVINCSSTSDRFGSLVGQVGFVRAGNAT